MINKNNELSNKFEGLNNNILETTKKVNLYMYKKAYKYILFMIGVILFSIIILFFVKSFMI